MIHNDERPTAEVVQDALGSVPADDRPTWLQIGMALHHWSSGSDEGLAVYDEWSRSAPDSYVEADVLRTWQSFGRNSGQPKTVATLFWMAESNGWKRPAKELSTVKPGKQTVKSPEEVLRGFQKQLHSTKGVDVLRDLKERRGLTDAVIDQFELGSRGGRLVFPIRGPSGEIVGFKVHKGPHLRPDGTRAAKGEGVKAQLYPLSHLSPDTSSLQIGGNGRFSGDEVSEGQQHGGPVIYIAAGEPDVCRLAGEGVQAVSGTAGEGTWKREWNGPFKGQDVVVLYDNDSDGEDGQRKVVRELKAIVRRLRVVRWPEDLPKGYDITDWLQSGKSLAELPLVEIHMERMGLEGAKAVVKRWLQLSPGEDLLVDVVLGAIVANRFSGDPVWILFVGPPGIIKTEILRTLAEWREIYMLSTLTASTLISGLVTGDKEDPSLLPKLDGLVLVIKDFTAILDMHREGRQQILGDLRDAFDGQMAKAFGSEAGTRSYRSKFGLLAAVTPAIDRYSSVGQQLGERFLKMRIKSHDPRSRIRRALNNSGREEQMRDELAAAMEGVLLNCDVDNEEAVAIDGHVIEKLVDLADCLAVLRSVVARDGYSKAIQYIPESEVGTRLVKQFAKLARGIAAVRGKGQVDEDEYRLIRRIARDTLSSKRCELVRTIYESFSRGFLPTQEIAERMNMPTETARLALEDLWLLKVVDRQGTGKFTWRMTEAFRERLAGLGFFDGDEVDRGTLEQEGGNGSSSDISAPQMQAELDICGAEMSEERHSAKTQEREQWTP